MWYDPCMSTEAVREKARRTVARVSAKKNKEGEAITRDSGPQMPHGLAGRLVAYIEHPLTLGGLGALIGVIGVFLYTPALLLSGALLLVGLHRSGALAGLPVGLAVFSWITLSVVICGSLWGVEGLIRKRLSEATQGANTSYYPISTVINKLGSMASQLDRMASTNSQPLTRTDLEQAFKQAQGKPYNFVVDGARVFAKMSYAKRVEFCLGCCAAFSDNVSFGLNTDLYNTGRLSAINLRHLNAVYISDHVLSAHEEDAFAEEAKAEFRKSAPISGTPHNVLAPGETIKFFTICDARFTDSLEASFRSGAVIIYVRTLLMYRDTAMPASKVGVTESWESYRNNFLSSTLCHNHNRVVLLDDDLGDL
jgi:hypothetical protein